MRWTMLAAVAAVAVTAGPAWGGPIDRLEAGLRALVGQPLSAAVEALGLPSGNMSMDQETTIYTWTQDAGELRCVVRLAVDAQRIVRRWSYDGNRGGCRAIARQAFR
jgi:hypothetical protein